MDIGERLKMQNINREDKSLCLIADEEELDDSPEEDNESAEEEKTSL